MFSFSKFATLVTVMALTSNVHMESVSAVPNPATSPIIITKSASDVPNPRKRMHMAIGDSQTVPPAKKLSLPNSCSCTWTPQSSPNQVAAHHAGNKAKTDLNSLPKEMTSLIMSHLSTVKDAANCRRVCKEWKHAVSSAKINLSGYSSMQDFLQRALEGSLHGTKSEQMNTLELLKSAPVSENMCSVAERLSIRVAAKYGHIRVLDHIYSRMETLPLKLDMLEMACRGQHPKHFDEGLSETADTIVWCAHEIKKLPSSDQVHRINGHIIAQGFYHRIPSISTGEVLALLPHQNDIGVILLAEAMGKSNPEGLLLLIEHIVRADPNQKHNKYALFIGLAMCKNCQDDHLTSVMNILQRHRVQIPTNQFVRQLFHTSCEAGNLQMVQIIQQRYPQHVNPDKLNVKAAIDSGNTAVLDFLLKRNPGLGLDWKSFHGFLTDNPSRLTALNSYILGSPDWRTAPIRELVQFYLQHGCGNEQDFKSFKTILAHSSMKLTQLHLWWAINRQLLPTITATCMTCRRNESTQFIDYLLKVKKIIPTQKTLDLALQKGRLDIVKLIVEEGRKLGSHFELNLDTLKTLMNGAAWLGTGPRQSYQEPALMDYILEQMNAGQGGKSLTSDQKVVLNQLLLTKPDTGGKGSYDCYISHIKQILSNMNS